MEKIKKRCIYVSVFFVLIFAVLSLRIAYFKLYMSDKLAAVANQQYSYSEKASDLDYLLLDRNGKELLDYKDRYYAVIDPYIFSSNFEDMDVDDLYALKYILKSYDSDYELPGKGAKADNKIYYSIDKATMDKLNDLKTIKGFYCYKCSQVDRGKFWKIENVLTSKSNLNDNSLKSKSSIESKIVADTSSNKYPEYSFERDVNGTVSKAKFVNPEKNVNVRLTIDKNIEDCVESVINDAKYKRYKQISAVLMEADTGKILAMVQKDNSEPNINLGGIGNGFEPGSIFKTIVEEAAIENNAVSQTEQFNATGLYEKEKHNIGKFTVEESYIKSINHVFAQIGNRIGFNSFYNVANLQGILKKEKVLNFDSEKTGQFATPQGNGDISLLSIGQNMEITPVQALSIPNTVVNKGTYVKPYIVDAYVDNNNNVIKSFDTTSAVVVSPGTAAIMKKQMTEVVSSKDGTGGAAYIDGMEIGGKTGTSTRIETSKTDPSKIENHSDGWFVGFFKINNKYYSMVVFVKDIDFDSEYAATTATPIFKEIVQSAYKYFQDML